MLKHWKKNARIAVKKTALVTGLVCCSIFFYEGLVKTVYRDHQQLADRSIELSNLNQQLKSELEWRKHNVSTSDAVFPNIIYLLQAFQGYRISLQGEQQKDPCVLYFTATPDSLAIASAIAQFSNSVSGCSTSGPMPFGNEDLDAMTTDGMVPGVILIHTDHDDLATGRLQIALENQIPTRLSHKLPKVPRDHLYASMHQYKEKFIWLQFGTGVNWNSACEPRLLRGRVLFCRARRDDLSLYRGCQIRRRHFFLVSVSKPNFKSSRLPK